MEERRADGGTEGWGTSGSSIFPASPLCLNSWSQSELDLACPQGVVHQQPETTPPVRHSTASTIHNRFPPFWLSGVGHKAALSAFELHSLMFMAQFYCELCKTPPIKLLFDFVKHFSSFFFHHRDYWKDTK